MTPDYRDDLNFVCGLAIEAGAVVREVFTSDFVVEFKDAAGTDPVTEADRRANTIIEKALAERFPDDAILTEESKPIRQEAAQKRLWCVDPVDGTREFVARVDQFVVMIGLAVRGESRMGVVYQPMTDKLWAGAPGTAFFEHAGERSPITTADTRVLTDATLAVSRKAPSINVMEFAKRVGIKNYQRVGSVGLKAALVADGSVDAYVSTSRQTREWDTCAPEAIVRAAGGIVTDIEGRPLRYGKSEPRTLNGFVATDGPLHHLVLHQLEWLGKQRRNASH